MKRIIFDTETTGLLKPSLVDLSLQPKIIELGILVVTDGEITRQYSQLFNPGEPLDAKITKITGITDEDVKDQPVFADEIKTIAEIFCGADVVIAHNAVFDLTIIKNELLRAGCEDFFWPQMTLCTVQNYKHLFNGKYPKLPALYQKIVGAELKQAHRALDDCFALYEILKKENDNEEIIRSQIV